jgi:hypothetical protein
MEPIERMAEQSVGRAYGFGLLAIGCFVLAFSFLPHLAAKFGGTAALLMSVIFLVKGLLAPRLSYRRTETWILLEKDERPQPEIAQAIIGNVLRATFFHFAQLSALLSAGMLATGFVLYSLGL